MFDLCSDLDSYGMNGNEQALFSDADALKVNKKGLNGGGIALNVDGEVVMANGEAVKGDENVMKGGREESKRDSDAEGRRKGIHVRTVILKVEGEELQGDRQA